LGNCCTGPDPGRRDSGAGDGEVPLPADLAYVNLGVENTGRNTTEAQRENARVTTAVIQRLVAQGVPADRIKSAGFGLYPQTTYDKPSGTEKITGYRVSNRLSVAVTDLARVGAVVDSAIAAGATNVDDVSSAGPPVLMRMKAADAAPSTPFLPGEVKVHARVTVQFALD
jgi:uncharacterized protein YggE